MERKTAFISGASRGIGEAIAITLSKEYNVIINYAHSEEGARAVLAQCDPNGRHKMIACDISDGDQVKTMLEEIVKEYGHLDVVVNNAGITKDNLLLSKEENKGKIGLFAGINKARFKRQVIPGDVLKLEAEVIRERMGIAFVNALASVDGEIALTAEMMFAVEDPKK